MGKSTSNNKKEKEQLIRKAGQSQAPERTTSSRWCRPVFALFLDGKFDELLKIESKYGRLRTFSNHPVEDFHIQSAFGAAHANAVGSSGQRDRQFEY